MNCMDVMMADVGRTLVFSTIFIISEFIELVSGTTCSKYSPYVLTCPQPGQPDDYTTCCYRNRVPMCCSSALFGAIFGGVFGGIILILSIIGIVCCVKIKQGKWVCVRVGPGKKYKVMTRAQMGAYQARQNTAIQQYQQQALQQAQQLGNRPGVVTLHGGQTAYWNPGSGNAYPPGSNHNAPVHGMTGNVVDPPPYSTVNPHQSGTVPGKY